MSGITKRLSPGVSTFEVDETLSVAGAVTLNGLFCGDFDWGPGNQAFLQSSEDTFKKWAGEPSDRCFKDWFNAAEFLREASGLYTVRVVSEDAKNAYGGYNGSGLSVDITSVNGSANGVDVNVPGSAYRVGDRVRVESNPTIVLIVTDVDDAGAVTDLAINAVGTNVADGADLSTENYVDFRIQNDTEFESQQGLLPGIIGRYPGALVNDWTVTVMRAAEYFSSGYTAMFRKAPEATIVSFNPDGYTSTFTVPAGFEDAEDRMVLVGGVQISGGAAPGEYEVTGTTLTIHPMVDEFTGNSLTDRFELTTPTLDISKASVTVGGQPLEFFDSNENVPYGFFSVDMIANEIIIGTKSKLYSGNGSTVTWRVETDDTLTATDVTVKVNGVSKTIVAIAPANSSEVQLVAGVGHYDFVFFNAASVPAGVNNIEIKWLYPDDTVDGVVATYGLPKGRDGLRVIFDQRAVHIVVANADGEIVETYNGLSMRPNAKYETGLSKYYVDVINRSSEYVRISGALSFFGTVSLRGGSYGQPLTAADYMNCYENYRNREAYDIRYFIDPVIDLALSNALTDLCDYRQDSVAFNGVPLAMTLQNQDPLTAVLQYVEGMSSSSYANVNPTWQMIYDRYNAKNRWVPCTGLDAGKYARTHAEREMWMVPAGYTNGVYRRALNVSWLPSEAQRDLLYVDGINFVVSDDGASFVLLGQKTLLRLESDFERMNIRFLSIYLKKNARQYLKGIMFEINDDITRATVRNSLNPFFRDIKTRRGIYEYVVKCDSENNDADVIDAEELVVTCYVKAAKLAEKIGLFLVYNKTGISFRESV